MALASGLARLPEEQRDPTLTTSYGTGELIRAGLDLGATTINVGIGGSATNDGGMGMAQALGIRFLDKDGRELPGIGASLQHVAAIDVSDLDPRIRDTDIAAVCDVDNPLCGEQGAARVYGPQKGASPEQVRELDQGLENLARLMERDLGVDILAMPGSGAAGGLGAGLHAFLGARLCKGIELIFAMVGLREKTAGADLVLTGEGQIDFQTVFGKAPGGVGALAKEMGIPCIAIAGSIGGDLGDLHQHGISAVFSLCTGPCTLQQAMEHGAEGISRVTEQILRCFLSAHPARCR
jgi:glycerate kinase